MCLQAKLAMMETFHQQKCESLEMLEELNTAYNQLLLKLEKRLTCFQ